MKKTNVLLIILFFTISFCVNAQTNTSNNALKTQAEKSNAERQKTSQNKHAAQQGNTAASNAVVVDENDPYQGRKAEFERLFASNKLPSDFPTYNKSYGIRGYNQVVDSYCSHHLDILTEQVRAKITGRQ